MTTKIHGSCLCDEVAFEMENRFFHFYLCHCKQCQKISGSSNVANLFTEKNNLRWTKGEKLLKRYNMPKRGFSNVFCSLCGTGLPFLSKSDNALLVPAGTLDDEPHLAPESNIFWQERASWAEKGFQAVKIKREP